MKYFTCEIRNVKIGGVDVHNAIIVTGVQTGATQPDFTYLIPEEYIGANIVGLRYIPETLSFEVVDADPDPEEPKPFATKEDIEKMKLDLQEAMFGIYVKIEGGNL